MQSAPSSRAPVRRYRSAEPAEEEQQRNAAAGTPGQQQAEPSAAEPAQVAAATSSHPPAASRRSSRAQHGQAAAGGQAAARPGKGQPRPARLAVLAAAAAASLALLGLLLGRRGRQAQRGSSGGGKRRAGSKQPAGSSAAVQQGGGKSGPLAGLRATSACVPLGDGSGCVVRRKIAADNSCMFNAVGYLMHHSTSKASWLRNVVAQEVSSDPGAYSDAFLGMRNAAYCQWIVNPVNWGGGIELAILAKHYACELAAWNIESGKCHVFGEDLGARRQVMLIYNGVHYDALAVAAHPKADADDDVTEFNPRSRRGKLIVAAARKLVALNHKGTRFVAGSGAARATSGGLKCNDCGALCAGQQEAMAHAQASGHMNFSAV